MKIEIGGGTTCQDGWINLDPRHGSSNFDRKIQDGIPLGDGVVDEVLASHVMEHIPAGNERIDAFNEVWRVLKSGGVFTIIVPIFRLQNGDVSWESVADPTHISFWVKESFDYFCQHTAHADYGIKLWELVSYSEGGYHGIEGTCVLRKP